MNQQKPAQAMTLFDLIARTWETGTAVRHLRFNGAGTSLAAVLDDGRMAFVSVKDAESPDTRLRIEADTGRASIRPRTKPLPLPVVTEAPVAGPDVGPCRLGDQGFAFAGVESGRLWRATARGQTLAMIAARDAPVTALAGLPRSGRIAVAHGNRVAVAAEEGGAEIASVSLPNPVSRIAVSGDETLLGCWGAGVFSIVSADGLTARAPIACPGPVRDMAFSPCNRWLACGCEDKALSLIDTQAERCDRIVDFPASVDSVGFSGKAAALLGSGAFRVVGWTLPDLPFGDHAGTAIETGRPGLTIVDRVAPHPKRDLCAVSYPTGLVVICRVGHSDEMLVREGTGAGVTALVWSDDGAHLAIGGADGSLSIATFPKTMFK